MKLKPCPFCGSEPECEIIGEKARPKVVTIFCQNVSCPANVCLKITTLDVDGVKIRWNTRAYENEISTLESRLKHLLQSDAVRLYDEFDPTISGGYKRDISELDRLVFDSKREEKTAHWDINVDGYYPFCSHCGEATQHMSPYCSNCGYRMTTRRHEDT